MTSSSLRSSGPNRFGLTEAARLLLCGLAFLIFGTAAWARHRDALPPVVGSDLTYDTTRQENICELAHQYGLASEHVAFANGIPADEYIDPNHHLVIPLRRILPSYPPRDGAVLNIPERGLYFFRGGHFRSFFPVAVGRSGFLTPRGQFCVINKTVNPTWYPPGWSDRKIPFPPGEDNPLGTRWIGLSAHGVGIHGTASPLAIGMSTSHGCIRMYPDQVERFYDQVYIGMPVRIEYETCKLGRDASNHVYLAVFPDVYGVQPPQQRVHSLLRGAGLGGSRIETMADGIAQKQNGVAESLAANQ